MKLVIEGMDGVGKSTVANAISKRFNMKYIDGLMNTYFKDEGFSEHELDIIHKDIGKQTKAAADAYGMQTYVAEKATIEALIDLVVKIKNK